MEEPDDPLLTDGNDEPVDELELLELDDPDGEDVEPDVPVLGVLVVPVVPVVPDEPLVPLLELAATVAALEAWARAATPTVPAMLIAARPPVIVLTRRRPLSRFLMDVFAFMGTTIPAGPEGGRRRA